MLSRVFGLPLAAVLVAVAVAACGGSHKPKTTATHTTTTTTTHPRKPAPKFISEEVHGPGASGYASTISARPGNMVAFRTVVPASLKGTQTIKLSFAQGPSKSLSITASTPQHSSTATVTSASGSSLTLEHIHYSCELPPSPSFCPAKHITTTSKQVQLQFSTTHAAGITVVGVVGPVTLPTPKSLTPGTAVVPAYKIAELLKVFPGGKATAATKSVAPTTSVTAKPGDFVEMVTRVSSKLHGARQPVTITIDQGPGSTITISASAKGGTASTATIKSKSGSPIELVLPRYTCNLPPLPTFCPPSKTAAASHPHRYMLTFMAAPGTAAPAVLVQVQAG